MKTLKCTSKKKRKTANLYFRVTASTSDKEAEPERASSTLQTKGDATPTEEPQRNTSEPGDTTPRHEKQAKDFLNLCTKNPETLCTFDKDISPSVRRPRNKFDRTTTTADTAECDKHHRDRNRLSLFFQAFSESGVDKFLLKPSGHHAIKSWHVIIKKKVVFLVLASTPCSFARKPKAEEGVQSIPASNITTSAS